jgi:hypothetical protein
MVERNLRAAASDEPGGVPVAAEDNAGLERSKLTPIAVEPARVRPWLPGAVTGESRGIDPPRDFRAITLDCLAGRWGALKKHTSTTLPREIVCFPRAIAAQLMCRRRAIDTIMFYVRRLVPWRADCSRLRPGCSDGLVGHLIARFPA